MRILVADDERPVIESISLIVRRELSQAFEIAGHAMSGKDAVEKAFELRPDIILMDVRMPGISGLEAIREMRKRGSTAVFVLVTAYERFEIAREAVELGVVDYLLKPVARDRLAQALETAAHVVQHRRGAERREIEQQERVDLMREFVEAAFLHEVALGAPFGADLERYRRVLEIPESCAVVGALSFLPAPGSWHTEEEIRPLHGKVRATVRYKTRALMGPLMGGVAALLLPVRDPALAAEETADLREILVQAHAVDFEKGRLRLGISPVRPLDEAGLGWPQAMAEVLGRAQGQVLKAEDIRPFEEDERFLEDVASGHHEQARLTLESWLGLLKHHVRIPVVERYRLVSVFGAALRRLTRQGALEADWALAMMDFEDLRAAETGAALDLAVRTRFSAMVSRIRQVRRRSPLVTRAMDHVHEHFGSAMSLETTAYALGISPNRLSRVFSEETGQGFSDYLIEYRIAKAKEMLRQPGASIKQVSAACGYADPNYFSRLFKKVAGCTPTSFSSDAAEADDGQA